MGNTLNRHRSRAAISTEHRDIRTALELVAQHVERRIERQQRLKKQKKRRPSSRSGSADDDDDDDFSTATIWAVRAVPARRKNRYHTQLTGSEYKVIETNASCAAHVLLAANHDLRLAGATCVGVVRDKESNEVVELVYECRNALSALAADGAQSTPDAAVV